MLTVFVEFTSTVEFIISATYIGRGPVAEHKSLEPEATTGAGSGNIILGKADKERNRVNVFNASI